MKITWTLKKCFKIALNIDIEHWSLSTEHWPKIFAHWSLTIDSWALALIIEHWLLIIEQCWAGAPCQSLSISKVEIQKRNTCNGEDAANLQPWAPGQAPHPVPRLAVSSLKKSQTWSCLIGSKPYAVNSPFSPLLAIAFNSWPHFPWLVHGL